MLVGVIIERITGRLQGDPVARHQRLGIHLVGLRTAQGGVPPGHLLDADHRDLIGGEPGTPGGIVQCRLDVRRLLGGCSDGGLRAARGRKAQEQDS